jgi:hypothetical protein
MISKGPQQKQSQLNKWFSSGSDKSKRQKVEYKTQDPITIDDEDDEIAVVHGPTHPKQKLQKNIVHTITTTSSSSSSSTKPTTALLVREEKVSVANVVDVPTNDTLPVPCVVEMTIDVKAGLVVQELNMIEPSLHFKHVPPSHEVLLAISLFHFPFLFFLSSPPRFLYSFLFSQPF